jgi:hypothetical protein
LGKNFYAYVIIDIKKRAIDTVEYLKNTRKKGFSKEEINAKLKEMGAFVLLSNKEIPLDEIIPLYYTRQSIEELLPLTKNHANTLPVRVQSENIFKGNLLISFIASAALLIINDYIKELNISTVELFEYFYTIKAIVNNDQLIICEGNQEASEIIEKFKLKFPDNTIMMSNSRQSDIIE